MNPGASASTSTPDHLGPYSDDSGKKDSTAFTGAAKKAPKTERQRESQRLRQFDRRRAKRIRKKQEKLTFEGKSISEPENIFFDDRTWKAFELLYLAQVGPRGDSSSLSTCHEDFIHATRSLFPAWAGIVYHPCCPEFLREFCDIQDRNILFLQRQYRKLPSAIAAIRHRLGDCHPVPYAPASGTTEGQDSNKSNVCPFESLCQVQVAVTDGRAWLRLEWLQHHLVYLPKLITQMKIVRLQAKSASLYVDPWFFTVCYERMYQMQCLLRRAIPFTPVYAYIQEQLKRQWARAPDNWIYVLRKLSLIEVPVIISLRQTADLTPIEIKRNLVAVRQTISRLSLLQASRVTKSVPESQRQAIDETGPCCMTNLETGDAERMASLSREAPQPSAKHGVSKRTNGAPGMEHPDVRTQGPFFGRYHWALKIISQAEPGHIWSAHRSSCED